MGKVKTGLCEVSHIQSQELIYFLSLMRIKERKTRMKREKNKEQGRFENKRETKNVKRKGWKKKRSEIIF